MKEKNTHTDNNYLIKGIVLLLIVPVIFISCAHSGKAANQQVSQDASAQSLAEPTSAEINNEMEEETPSEEMAADAEPDSQEAEDFSEDDLDESFSDEDDEFADDFSDDFGDEGDDFLDDEFEDEDTEGKVTVADPLYYFNKAMFHVNDKLYFWCLKPVATGYNKVTPRFVRTGFKNFFHNLVMPVRFVSNTLQFKIKGAGTELGRFLINTTLGVAGFWDPAEKWFDMNPSEEDLGQTLGSYGIGNGFYIVWPFLGPSTLRDSVGLAGDTFLNPITYLEPWEAAYGAKGYDQFNRLSFHLGDYETLKGASLDPYVMMRDFYIQYRMKKVEE